MAFSLVAWVTVWTALGAGDATEREMLEAHNRARARAGVSKLAWSDKLAATAQDWAKSLARSGQFAHRPRGRYGENLFDIRGARATPAEVVGAWVAEVKDYNARKNTCRRGALCGHYTQVIWGNTKFVGCAVAERGRRQVWVCNYDPPGNIVGQRPK